MGKEVVLHTHFNAPEEITWITEKAMRLLFERGIFTRNQSVLIRGVNDTRERMQLLVKRLGHINVHAYYVYMHDMVKGVEELRTTIFTATDTEKFVRGSTAGFNTPTFVVRRARRRRQARRALVRILRSRERHRRLRRAERQARQGFRLFRPDRQTLARGPRTLGFAPDAGADDPSGRASRRRRRRTARFSVSDRHPEGWRLPRRA